MQSEPPRGPKSRHDRPWESPVDPDAPEQDPDEPKLAPVIDLHAVYMARKKARSDKYGQPRFVPQLTRELWVRDYDPHPLGNILLQSKAQISKGDLAVMVWLLLNSERINKPVTRAEIARGLKVGERYARQIVADLSAAGFIINLGTERKQNLRVNSIAGHWNFRELARLRKARNDKRNARFPPEF